MSGTEPAGNLTWRVMALEREVERLKEGKPEVIADRVRALGEEIHELRLELAAIRKLVIGAFATIATGLTIAVALQNAGAF